MILAIVGGPYGRGSKVEGYRRHPGEPREAWGNTIQGVLPGPKLPTPRLLTTGCWLRSSALLIGIMSTMIMTIILILIIRSIRAIIITTIVITSVLKILPFYPC